MAWGRQGFRSKQFCILENFRTCLNHPGKIHNKKTLNLKPTKQKDKYIGVSYCYYNKLLQTSWLRTMQVYYLTVWEIRRPKWVLQVKVKVSRRLPSSRDCRRESILGLLQLLELLTFLGSRPASYHSTLLHFLAVLPLSFSCNYIGPTQMILDNPPFQNP